MQIEDQLLDDHFFDDLNPPQLQAVEHFKGPILVLAGAGSGKTRVLTKRIAHLVLKHRVPPGRILAVTFTNKATEEMRERLHRFLGERGEQLWVATFHSAALRILRRYAMHLGYRPEFVVYDVQDSNSLLKSILKDSGIDDKKFPVALFDRAIDQAKNSYILPEQLTSSANDFASQQIADVYDRYQKALMRANAMDFGDLLVNVVLLFERHPEVLERYKQNLHFVLVDEFQDTNLVQYKFIRMITDLHRNLLVVGDDDQSIYKFRGATISNILDFEQDFPDAKVITLEQNYRSTANILAAAHGVISRNKGRKDKKLWTAAESGSPIVACLAIDEGDEAQFVVSEIKLHHRQAVLGQGASYRDVAVFYRTNAQSRALEEALMSAHIPYRIYGGLRFYDRKEIRDVLGYLRLISSDTDDQAFMRIVNTPPRGIGAQSVKVLSDAARENGMALMTAALKGHGKGGALSEFVKMITELREMSNHVVLSELVEEILKRTDYRARVKAAKDLNAESRLENLKELIAIARGMQVPGELPRETLQRFLDRVTLASSADIPTVSQGAGDGQGGENKPAEFVSLMTLHMAKGLEFPIVFFTGLEEGLLPHQRSMYDPEEVEEERRLCYVGMTRAMRILYLTRAAQRSMFSGVDSFGYRDVSRFMYDVPDGIIQHRGADFLHGGVSNSGREDKDEVWDEEFSDLP